MAAKPIPLEDAAKMLGITPEELAEYHARNEILDVRGTKVRSFKQEELQRFADEQGLAFNPSGSGGSASAEDPSLSDSLVLDDEIAESSELVLDGEEGDSKKLEELSENTGSNVLDSPEAEPGESGSDTGKMVGGDGDDDLLLSEEDLFDDGDLSLSDDGDISLDSDSDLEDSDLVLEEDSSGEVALSAEESGINLSPTDSGLSLEEESIELEGSDIDALELPEDDDMIEIEGEVADADAATQLKQDEDFVLTPVEEAMDEESSGSQVIDLESSEIYVDESSSEIFEEGVEDSAQPLVAEDPGMFGEEVAATGVEPTAATAATAGVATPAAPESPYTIWQILALASVLLFVCVGCMIAIDAARNLWQYDGEGAITSTFTDIIIKAVGINPN